VLNAPVDLRLAPDTVLVRALFQLLMTDLTTSVRRRSMLLLVDQGWTNAATIIDTSTKYTQSLGEYFVETFNHLDGTVASEVTYTVGGMQINAQIQRLQNLRAARCDPSVDQHAAGGAR
jgi:hypothetical protein